VTEHRPVSGRDVAGLGHDLEVVLGVELHAEPAPDDLVIVCQDDPDGLVGRGGLLHCKRR
jgi:hypothetical protein